MTKVIDVGNEAQVKEQKISKKLVRDQELADLKHLLSTPNGRRFIWRMMIWCGVFDINFYPDQDNLTNFKLGMRNIGLMLIDECDSADPSAYILMQQEAVARKLREGR
ncbi:MAG TPA: hypothetical protein ENI11_02880 [Actinobacteria bacterium]|nr:hypothetical protein [Actinomycetota bacterium]